ncbi:hypothetical protein M758_3G220900 [Ceratodon purpureus]|nr:hypothetical protein M758_3G220900 [Ceratodon purpureus]
MTDDGRRIGQSKRHDIILKMPIPCAKCSLPLVSFFYPHKIIGSTEIYLCIDLGLAELVQKSRY